MSADRENILAPGFNPPNHVGDTYFPAVTTGLPATGIDGILYPVTAAQLLPICTGFLVAAH
jgi:hypothetical protein